LVVTEGEVTEREYLDGFVRECRNPRVTIRIKGGAGAPKTIVECAKELKRQAEKTARREKDDNLLFDQVWCVFDIDQHPNINDAKQMARDNNMELAVSNPCIELWLWLHFAEQPGMQHRHKLQAMMKKHVPDYDKHVQFSDYKNGYADAKRRADQLDTLAVADHDDGRNPTTGFWRLTESIESPTD
jgi:hypothetical protein